jgi:hypothetical protein
VLLVTVGQGMFRGLQNMRTPLLITILTNVVHLGLDGLFIFGLHMGLQGAAISTTASEWAAAGLYMALLWQQRQTLGLWPPPVLTWQQMRSRYMPFMQVRLGKGDRERLSNQQLHQQLLVRVVSAVHCSQTAVCVSSAFGCSAWDAGCSAWDAGCCPCSCSSSPRLAICCSKTA